MEIGSTVLQNLRQIFSPTTQTEKAGRTELKYICSYDILAIISHQIRHWIALDEHAEENGLYTVKSVYFDDIMNSSAMQNDAGDGLRDKYRIRMYGADQNTLRLEKKRKMNTFSVKSSCPVDYDTYSRLTTGDVSPLLYGDTHPLIKELSVKTLANHFRPKVIIQYERMAFHDTRTNIRITLDINIRASGKTDAFLNQGYFTIPVQEQGQHVLEVKYDRVFPQYIRRQLEAYHLQQATFSKYYMGRQALALLE